MTRRSFLKFLATLLASGTAMGSYAFALEPGYRLNMVRYPVKPQAWPRGLNLKIAAIADPHAGEPYMSLNRLSGIVDLVNAQQPDLIVLLGDYAADHRFVTRRIPPREIAQVLAGLKAPLGRYAVLGNHDWWADERAQTKGDGPTLSHLAFAEAGIPLLDNDALRLSHRGTPFWLLGLGDQLAFLPRSRKSPKRANISRAITGTDDLPSLMQRLDDDHAPAILLAHEPDIFPNVPERIALTMSGHTHGGQVRLFGYAPIVPSRFGNRYAYGHIVEQGRHLVVSGGLGCSVLPVRFGSPPEITMVELS